MRVLILHNRYRNPGGEDAAVESESRLLEQHGVEVMRPEFDNEVDDRFPILGAVRLAAASAWSRESYHKVHRLCKEFQPDIVHVHNFWMRLSPSVHAAARDCGAATVQSLHNYRLSCVNGMQLRDGKQCDDCVGRVPWRGVLHRCQHGSIVKSAAVARMIASNRSRRTWETQVDAFIAPSEYARARAIAAGITRARTFVKVNAAADPGKSATLATQCTTAMFAGRLSEEKGVAVLLDAWAMLGHQPGRQLMIVGDGPARATLESRAAALGLTSAQVQFAGWKSPAEVTACLRNSRFFVLPSLCGETFGTSVVEAFACARPAVVTEFGGQGEIVEDDVTGLKVTPGDVAGLARAIQTFYADQSLVTRMGQRARASYLARYTPEQGYRTLMKIYQFALSRIEHTPQRWAEEIPC